MQETEDLIVNMRMKRQNYRRTGSCTGAVCVGWNAMNVMWAVTSEVDQEHGTDYQARLKKRKSPNRKRSRKTIIHFKIKLVRETGAK